MAELSTATETAIVGSPLKPFPTTLCGAMTWVFGSPTILGSGLCVADIQVTTGDGEVFDCLRKLYPMERNLIAGFAGDVRAGFEMLTALYYVIHNGAGAGEPVDVERAFERFPKAAARAFSELPQENCEGGSEVLLVGAIHAANALYESRPMAARFVSPNFSREEIRAGDWGSIGSGTNIDAYRQELEGLTSEDARNLMQLEINAPGMYAQAMSFAVVEAVGKMPPVRGISRHFHTGVVFAHGSQVATSDRTWYGDQGTHEIRMPEVADSWESVQALLARLRGRALSGTATA
jgi:hypothetical protein